MKNGVKGYQIALLILLIVPGGKYLTLPALLASIVGRDAWLVTLTMLCVDAVGLTFVLWALKINAQGLSINEVLSRTLSPVGAKILFVLLAAVFMLKASILMLSCYRLFAATFSVKTSWPGFCTPIAALSVFVVSRGFRTIARLNEFFVVLIIVAVAAILFFAAQSADWINLLPVLDDKAAFIRGLVSSGIWFNDYLFILFLFDDFEKDSKIVAPALVCFAVATALTVAMNALFIGIFGSLAQYSDLAMSKVSQFSLVMSNGSRLDWLSLSIWTITLFIKIFIYVFCIYKCFESVFCLHKEKFHLWLAVVVNVPLLVVPLFVSIDQLVTDVMASWVKWIFYLPLYVLPFLSPLLVKIASKKSVKEVDDAAS